MFYLRKSGFEVDWCQRQARKGVGQAKGFSAGAVRTAKLRSIVSAVILR